MFTDGLTESEFPVTLPIPEMLRLVPPVVDQLNTLLCPAVMVEGVAVKLAMVGALGMGAETGTCAVPVSLPPQALSANPIISMKIAQLPFSVRRIGAVFGNDKRASLFDGFHQPAGQQSIKCSHPPAKRRACNY